MELGHVQKLRRCVFYAVLLVQQLVHATDERYFKLKVAPRLYQMALFRLLGLEPVFLGDLWLSDGLSVAAIRRHYIIQQSSE